MKHFIPSKACSAESQYLCGSLLQGIRMDLKFDLWFSLKTLPTLAFYRCGSFYLPSVIMQRESLTWLGYLFEYNQKLLTVYDTVMVCEEQ